MLVGRRSIHVEILPTSTLTYEVFLADTLETFLIVRFSDHSENATRWLILRNDTAYQAILRLLNKVILGYRSQTVVLKCSKFVLKTVLGRFPFDGRTSFSVAIRLPLHTLLFASLLATQVLVHSFGLRLLNHRAKLLDLLLSLQN